MPCFCFEGSKSFRYWLLCGFNLIHICVCTFSFLNLRTLNYWLEREGKPRRQCINPHSCRATPTHALDTLTHSPQSSIALPDQLNSRLNCRSCIVIDRLGCETKCTFHKKKVNPAKNSHGSAMASFFGGNFSTAELRRSVHCQQMLDSVSVRVLWRSSWPKLHKYYALLLLLLLPRPPWRRTEAAAAAGRH